MPQAIASALVTYAGFTATAATVTAYAVVIAGTLAYSDYSRRKAQARARAAANASAKDREVMIRSAIAPRRIVYGRDRISGPIVYMESTGDKSQYLHMVVALAAHECDAIETVYFNEVALPEADGDGWITSGEYAKGSSTQADTHTGTTNGSGQITLPRNAESITAAYTEIGVGEAATQTHHTGYSHTAGSNTITGLPADTSVTIGYTYTQAATPLVRVRKYLGTADQTACADLVAESDGKWTSDHRGRGICYLYVRLEYDQDVFGSTGVPNISAVVRGKKVYDPRTTTTAWSNNAALCVADYLRSDEGMRADTAEVPDSEIIAAANICDEEVDLSLDDEDVQARYTCDLSITTDRSPRDVLAELLACMSGRAVWTQGRWLVRPGAYRTPTLTITADMLAGPVSVMPKASRSELFNAVRATYRDATSFAELQAPLVENSGYEAEDGGVQIVRQIDVPTLSDTYRAQRLAKIELERARQALTVNLTCNLKAYDLAPSDTVLLTLATYGWSAKAFEVLERTLTREGTIQYTLRETAAGVYDWAWGEATIGDLAPDTNLPNPFGLPAILQNLAADEDAIRLGDGTIVTQAVVTWDQSTSPFVPNGGSIQYQTARVGTPWGTGSLPGDATSVTLGPLQVGVAYVFRARAINASGRAGDWAYIGLVAEGLAAPPDDVTGLDYEIKPGQVWITWDPCEEADYAATELRYDGTGWSDATFLWRGAGSDYQHPRPPNGTYIVRAKHIDTSGTYSTNAASISVTVDDSIDQIGTVGLLTLTTDRFPFFSFADGTTHTAQAPGDGLLTITANLINLFGTASFVAEAFDARIGGSSLGAVTLGGAGNARTMTAAQFVAPGTSGSVRRVRVTATLGSASDTLDVYRQDSTTTAPILYLSNPTHAVPTDESGEYGDYSGAETEAAVYEGLADTTDDWTWSITPDSGVTATINGGAGPVANPTSVLVAVSAMTAPTGAVLVEADDGVDTLSASFVVDKAEASGSGYQVVWSPRSEIRLPVTAAGDVASYADAWSEYRVIKGGSLDDTANWAASKTDINVSSTLSGNRVDVTELLALGALGTPATGSVPWASAGWTALHAVIDTPGAFLAAGQFNAGPSNYVMTSPMDGTYGTWTLRDVGASGKWMGIAYDEPTNAMLVIEKSVGGTNKLRRSTDNGETWSGAVNLPASSQWYDIAAGNGTVQISSQVSSTGCFSNDGGATWSTRSYPVAGLTFVGHIGAYWIARDTYDLMRVSTDNGATWSLLTTTGWPSSAHVAVAYKGRLAVTFRYAATNKAAYYEPGVGWVVVTLPQFVTNGSLACIKGVLYMLGGAKVLYSTDGKRWDIGPDNAPWAGLCQRSNRNLDLDFLPAADGGSGSWGRYPLLATSATDGGVRMRFTKPGELPMESVLPVFKDTAASDVYTYQANPGFLLLPATSDGVVTDWSSASITARANKNGTDDTANWAWTWTASNMTPSSGIGATATFTAMSADTGQVTFRGSKAGQADITGTLNIAKAKGGIPAGPIVGGAFHVISATTTWIGLKFLGDGRFQVKRGSGGSYQDAGQWAGAVLASNTSFWVRVSATGHSLDSGTTDTWLAMTTDREYVLSDATSGTHLTSLTVLFATDNTGANAVIGFGSLQLVVP
ncbi:MAG: phage tail protein [Burkholderiales bacterium]|nr:phage tail protein [Burkholderiales bacterium]